MKLEVIIFYFFIFYSYISDFQQKWYKIEILLYHYIINLNGQ